MQSTAKQGLLVISFLAVLLVPASRAQGDSAAGGRVAGAQDPELGKEGRKEYMGREIARTMHWSGAEWLMRETREDEENAQLLRAQLGLVAGQTVCDLGCGNGYYTLPMAEAVGAEGKVYAVDIQQPMLTMLDARVKAAGYGNVEGILGTYSDPKLGANRCDLIVMVDVYHEISHPVTVLAHLREALKEKGQVVLVEFRSEDPKVPIKKLHKMSKAQVIAEMAANGLVFKREFDGLPWQHLMAFGRDASWSRDESKEARDQRVGRAVAEGLMRSIAVGDLLGLGGYYRDKVIGAERSESLKSWVQMMKAGEAIHEVRAAEGELRDVRAGDLLLDLVPGKDAGHLYWLLRCNGVGQWQVIAERTDL